MTCPRTYVKLLLTPASFELVERLPKPAFSWGHRLPADPQISHALTSPPFSLPYISAILGFVIGVNFDGPSRVVE